MLRFNFPRFAFSGLRSKISVEAVGNIDFRKIDPTIIQLHPWGEMYPDPTVVSVPKERAAEIIAKLKLHDAISRVNGELTPRGEIVQKRFESTRPPRNK